MLLLGAISLVIGESVDLDELFRPTSVAVVGASNRPGTVGASLFRNALTAGFRGVVYPVNPHWKSVSGVRCYPSVEDLPETPDLGVVIVAASQVPSVVASLGKMGTKGVIVVAAGFREVGEPGVTLQEELVATTRRYRMSLVGPNCFGVLNTDPTVSLNATFSESLPTTGNIAFVSQSGALCAGILKYGSVERIGFSRFVSVGNRAGVDESDLLLSLGRDDRTRVVLLYIESLADGRRFLETAREVTEHKPVLVIKSGRSPVGERAAKSHTGSLARSGQDRLFDSLFEQSGVLRAETIGDLFRNAKIFSSGLRLEAPQLAILTNSGGPGIVAADACARNGLELPVPPPTVRVSLAGSLSPSASIGNPVDMTADAGAEQYRTALHALLDQPEIAAALVIATPTGTLTGTAAAQAILDGKAHNSKPVVACLFGLTDLSEEVGFLERNGIPTFTFPEEAVAGLASLARYRAWQTRPKTEVRSFPVDAPSVERALAQGRALGNRAMPEYIARALLAGYGVRFAKSELVHDPEEAVRSAREIGFPVVLKVASPDISHKTEVGGVALNLLDESHLRAAFHAMKSSLSRLAPHARLEGFEVEAMVPRGTEVIVGVQRDPMFGPVVLFGLGGIYVEILRDVTFRLAPLRSLSAAHMVSSVRAFPLLTGVRGEPPGDLEALYEVIERVSQLAVEVPEIVELDINPIVVRPVGEGVIAVDARVVLAPTSKSAPLLSDAR